PRSTLLPYTTLFRSRRGQPHRGLPAGAREGLAVAPRHAGGRKLRPHPSRGERDMAGAVATSFRIISILGLAWNLVGVAMFFLQRSEEHTSELQSREK